MSAIISLAPAAVPLQTMTVYAAAAVAAPDNLYWADKRNEDEGSYAYWDEVENARSYTVYLYREADNGDTFSKIAEVSSKKPGVNLKGKMRKSGDYCFRVKAVAKSGYSNSAMSAYSDTAYFEKTVSSTSTAVQTTGGPGASSLTGWKQNENGWRYLTDNTGSAWYRSCWQWLDGNKDGIAECYYFGPDGYAYMNTTTPDGYEVNADGAWTVNGVVQTRRVAK